MKIDIQNKNQQSSEKEIKTGWLSASNFLKNSTKDVFKVIELTGEYTKIIFSDIDDLFPVSTLIKAVKQAYSTLVWQDVSVSTTKWVHQAIVLNKKRDKKSFIDLTRASLGSLWDAQKLLKWVDKFKILAINSVVLTRVSLLGGAAYFVKSSESAYLDGLEFQKLDPAKDKTKVQFQAIKIINNLAKSLIGAIVFASAAFGYVASMPFILFIGTTIIGTNILKAYYKS
jgi:hypothetical protein